MGDSREWAALHPGPSELRHQLLNPCPSNILPLHSNVAQARPGSGDSGRYGGNMDFNEIVEGATVYLPVSVPGALLYVGDGHALQGDGELNGNALETSMDVEFTVDVIPGKRVPGPRVGSVRNAPDSHGTRWIAG